MTLAVWDGDDWAQDDNTPTDLIRDTFSRTVASGWGTADTGGAWTSIGGTSVADGVGKIQMGASDTRRVTLESTPLTDFEVSLTMVMDKVANGGGIHFDVLGRRTAGGEVRAKVRISATGVIQLSIAKVLGTAETILANITLSEYPYTAGVRLNVKLSLVGAVVKAKAWPETASEPEAWRMPTTLTDSVLLGSGVFGIRTYGSGTITNGPVTVSVDNISIPGGASTPGPRAASFRDGQWVTSPISRAVTWREDNSGWSDGSSPQRIALIGDSTLYQISGNGDQKIRDLLVPLGWAQADTFFYARINKTIATADDQGYTTLQNMAQARAAIGEPDVWVFNLGANGHNSSDANNAAWINAILSAAGNNARVIWVGLSQASGYDAGATSEATRQHWNSIAKPVVQAHPRGQWLDWYAYTKTYPGGDGTWWQPDSLHMNQLGYDRKNAFITNAIGSP